MKFCEYDTRIKIWMNRQEMLKSLDYPGAVFLVICDPPMNKL
jgi:hypothetical protein